MAPQVGDLMHQYHKKLPQNVLALLSACPPEACGIRRELLVAIRHIVVTDWRKGFGEHVRSNILTVVTLQIDAFLSEDLLVGRGRACRDSLRPLAYSSLGDLILRLTLNRTQQSKVVYLYSRNIHDPNLPFQVQILSAKLLMNVIENLPEKDQQGTILIFYSLTQKGRVLFLRIIDTIVRRFGSLRRQMPSLLGKKEIRNETNDIVFSANATKGIQARDQN
jgi:transformation/transcription domain-associated protein